MLWVQCLAHVFVEVSGYLLLPCQASSPHGWGQLPLLLCGTEQRAQALLLLRPSAQLFSPARKRRGQG